MEALKIYDCDRGKILALYTAIRASRIPKVVALNPASEDDLIIVETIEVNEGDVMASKKSIDSGNNVIYIASKLIAEGSKQHKFVFLKFMTRKLFTKYKEDQINKMVNKIIPYNSYVSGDTEASISILEPHIREILIKAPSLKKPEVFHSVSDRMYLPYLTVVQTDTVKTEEDENTTKMSIEYEDNLVFYQFSISLLSPQSDILISYKKVLYKFKQHELMQLLIPENEQDKSATKAMLLPVSKMKDFSASLPF